MLRNQTRIILLFLPFISLLFFGFSSKKKIDLSKKWIQIQTNQDGSESYYKKYFGSKNNKNIETELEYHTFVSSLELLSDSTFINGNVNFEYAQSDYSLTANWNGKWWSNTNKDSTFLYLQTTMEFMYGYDPVVGSNTKAPSPHTIVFKFYLKEYSAHKIHLQLMNKGYFPNRDLKFISEEFLLEELKNKHKDELTELNAVFYQDLIEKNGKKYFKNDEPFSGKAVVYYENGMIYKNYNKLIIQEYQDGSLNGNMIYYYPDGNLKNKYTFLNGEKTGKVIAYSNVQGKSIKAYEGNYLNGKMHGEFIYFDAKGHKKSMSTYENNRLEGKYALYVFEFKKEILQVDGWYTNNVKDSVWKYFNEYGQEVKKEIYEKGKLIKTENKLNFEGTWQATKQMVDEFDHVCQQTTYTLKIYGIGYISKKMQNGVFQQCGYLDQTPSIHKKFQFDSNSEIFNFYSNNENEFRLVKNYEPVKIDEYNLPIADPEYYPNGDEVGKSKVCLIEKWVFIRVKG